MVQFASNHGGASSADLGQIDLSAKRVAVTGAGGFLGGYVVTQLQRTGAVVVAVVDRNRGSRHDALTGPIDLITFDRPDQIVSAVQAAKPDYVIHLHAVVTTERTARSVKSTLESNLMPSLDLMTACGEMNLQRLILMGTGEEFGPVTGPFDDHTIADPPSPYGASKAAVTGYAKMFHNAFGLPVVVLRPSVVYGPGQGPRMLIPQVMHALAAGREIDVTEGRQTRDFIYAEDVARGILCALVAKGIDGHSYNLASGEVVTVADCLHRIESITGYTGLIRYGKLPYKPGEIFSYEPVPEKTRAALNWRSLVSLDEGLAKTWAALNITKRTFDDERVG
jgi:nucleoside-diphosphate-sugar epimerase